MYHNFFIPSSVNGYLGCFHVLPIVNSAAMNNGIHVSISILVGLLRVGLLGHMASTLAWKLPWMEEPSRLQSMGSRRSDTTEQLHFHFHALEKEMASHSSVLSWRIPGTGEPGGLPSMGSHRVRLE